MEILNIIRGDTYVLEFPINDEDKNPIKIDDIKTLLLTARELPNKKSPVLFSKTKEDFSIVDDMYNVTIEPTDTEQLDIVTFYFDIEATLFDGTRGTIIRRVDLTKDYTIHKEDVWKLV